MSVRLRKFTPGEVFVTGQNAHSILRFFSIEPGILPQAMTVADRAFAQALLVEAIDASYEMGYAEAIFRSVFGKTPASLIGIAGILATLTIHSAANWFQHASASDLKDPQIYESVRVVIARNWATVWRIRLATGQLTY